MEPTGRFGPQRLGRCAWVGDSVSCYNTGVLCGWGVEGLSPRALNCGGERGKFNVEGEFTGFSTVS